MIKLAFVCAALTVSVTATAETYEFSSGDQQVALVELFTSEGCSSCPPADRWMSNLKDKSDLWETVVPVAFHVDYWDYIGWKDRFASPEFSDRQRQYERDGNVNTVYTPGLFLNGEEWRGWYWGRTATSGDESSAGDLWIEVDNGTVSAEFEATDVHGSDIDLHVALLGMDIETDVQAGENRGNTLGHDFVVLNYESTRMGGDTESGMTATLELGEPSNAAGNWAIAAWVSTSKNQAPIQATGGYIQIDANGFDATH